MKIKMKTKSVQGPTEIRTRIAGFKVQSANRYTMGPFLSTFILVWIFERVLDRTFSRVLSILLGQ